MIMLWIMAAALTLAVLLSIVIPVWKRSLRERSTVGEYEHDVEVYRHQLRELEAETQRGTISETDAKQARAEIAKRLLSAEDKAEAERALSGGKDREFANIFLMATLLFFVPSLTLNLYLEVGSPLLPAQPLEARLEIMREQELLAQSTREEMQRLVQRAESHLEANPEDGQGWNVLAPIYFRAGRFEDAETAYRNALRLLGNDAQRLSGLGEVIFARSSGVVTQEAQQLFTRALELDPNDDRARFFGGLAAVQSGDSDAGQALWEALANDGDADPNWIASANEGLSRLTSGNLASIPGVQSDAPAAPGMPQLDQNTVDGMMQMDADARAEIIEGMVSSLDARLRENPDDIDGWKRLIRAHIVMDNQGEAIDALNRALESQEQNSEWVQELQRFAADVGLLSPDS